MGRSKEGPWSVCVHSGRSTQGEALGDVGGVISPMVGGPHKEGGVGEGEPVEVGEQARQRRGGQEHVTSQGPSEELEVALGVTGSQCRLSLMGLDP